MSDTLQSRPAPETVPADATADHVLSHPEPQQASGTSMTSVGQTRASLARRSLRRPRTSTLLALAFAFLGAVALYRQVLFYRAGAYEDLNARQRGASAGLVGLVHWIPGRPEAVQITDEGLKTFGVETVSVEQSPPPEPLRLSGSILLDPNRMVRIHARFPGELVSLGTVPVHASRAGDDAVIERRPLQFGDHVSKGQILAVVWSKDVGEKKSEYVDAISKRDIDKTLLDKYEQASQVISQRTIFEARRNYEADLIAVARAERTLRSWRLTDEEIQEIRAEAKRVQKREVHDAEGDRVWAETEIRCPINGIILEKNFNIGDILDPAQDLFKVADLDRVQVAANAYEEDLPLLKNLDPEHRKWKIDIKADPHDVPIDGTFDIIGNIIDPAQHAGAVMGTLDNPGGRLSIGEFITATIPLPADPALVLVPTSALIEDGHSTQVFVEIDGQPGQFARRKIAVVTRGRQRTYVRGEPNSDELAAGDEWLKPGDRVIASGAMELAAALKALPPSPHEP